MDATSAIEPEHCRPSGDEFTVKPPKKKGVNGVPAGSEEDAEDRATGSLQISRHFSEGAFWECLSSSSHRSETTLDKAAASQRPEQMAWITTWVLSLHPIFYIRERIWLLTVSTPMKSLPTISGLY